MLERINIMAVENAARHREHMAIIGAMARAIISKQTSVEDVAALVGALERLADTLMLEAELDVEQLRYVNDPHADCSESDEDELTEEGVLVTKH
jgi:hypothetical protein